jgi:oligopeptide/dipeptide ABC transporter ATP-binding protein
MYLGKLVELAGSRTVYYSHHHPYTRALLSAVPLPDPRVGPRKERIILQGDVPSPIDRAPGCVFRPRCAHATEICRAKEPELRRTDSEHAEHWTACHHAEKIGKGEKGKMSASKGTEPILKKGGKIS